MDDSGLLAYNELTQPPHTYVLTIVPLLIATAISAWLAVYARLRRPARGMAPLATLMAAVALWSLGYALELASGSLPTKIFWAKFQYLGIVTIPVAWLALALEYTGWERWVTARTLLPGSIIPLTTLLLVWTNDAHGLIWREIGLDTSGSPSVLVMPYGSWFWVHTAYSYLLLSTDTVLPGTHARSDRAYPVIHLTDGDVDGLFPLVRCIAEGLSTGWMMPRVIGGEYIAKVPGTHSSPKRIWRPLTLNLSLSLSLAPIPHDRRASRVSHPWSAVLQ